jgi:DNA-directed RNA polymerase subunit RPC12/RpoP
MGFLNKLRKLFRHRADSYSGGSVRFGYGCPRCAQDIHRQIQDSGREWPVASARAKVVKGTPPFSYRCHTCESEWRVSDPFNHTREGVFRWYAAFLDGSGHLFSVGTCPHCQTELSRFREHAAGDQERDHYWCMSCGIEEEI